MIVHINRQMVAPFPHAYGLTHIVFYHMLKFIYVCQEGNIQFFFIEMFYLRLPLPYYNKRITRVAKIKKKQENTAYHNVLIVQS